MDWSGAMAVAETQRGVITRRQLVAAGCSRATLTRAVGDGRLVRMLEGVYRFPITPLTWEARATAALLNLGAAATLSHASAAAFWGLPHFSRLVDEPLHLSLARKHSRRLPGGYEVHRSRRPITPYERNGLRTTRLARTLVDLAAVLDEERLEICLDDAHRRFRQLDAWLRDELKGLTPKTNPGGGALRRLLEVRKGVTTESPLETRLRRAIRERKLPDPTWQLDLSDAEGFIMRVDAAYEDHRVAVHGDSYQWHSSRQAFDTDASQRRRIAALGWVSIAVTNTDLDSEHWVDELVRLLEQRHPQRDFFIPHFSPRPGAPPGSSRPAR